MGRFIIYLFLIVFSYGGQVLNVSYFPNNSKIDILFSLDKPFKGKISLVKNNVYQISGISFNRTEEKKFDNNLKVIISPISNDEVELKILDKNQIKIKASITAKGYGLRLRLYGFEIKQPTTENNMMNENLNQISKTQNNSDFNMINYLIVMIILVVLIIILLIIKKKTLQKLPKQFRDDKFKILSQRMIDPKTKIVLFEIYNRKYLVLFGDKNNLLLDNYLNQQSFQNEQVEQIFDDNGFESLLNKKIDEEQEYIKKASKLKEENEF